MTPQPNERPGGLHRYWFRFDPDSRIPIGFNLGCGITARTQEDALHLLGSIYPSDKCSDHATFVISEVVTDVDLRSLDSNHVLPNVGDSTQRGVWFPNFGSAKDDRQ